MGCLDSLQHLHIHCVLRITPLKSVAWYLSITLLWASSQAAQAVKKPAASAGDAGEVCSIPGLGRSPGAGNGSLLQYSFLELSMDRGAQRAAVHGVTKESDRTEHTLTHFHMWNLVPRLVIEPTSPALQGGFLITTTGGIPEAVL